ncbi:MAG: inovirus Gp2 family protein [Marinomonas sp.]|uniref:inovirus Gp2 family protein n=1 Tax=Marinomonas sp. TaxID=1904862 RepID=UPI003F9E0A8F
MQKHSYQGLPILGSLEDHNSLYLDRLLSTMSFSLSEHPRTYAIRVDLRLPDFDACHDCLSRDEIVSYNRNRTNLMKKFTESLSAKVKAQGARMRREGKRVHSCTVRYVWVKERDTVINDHYHIVLFFNKDRFHRAGEYSSDGSLASMIIAAWSSALGCSVASSFRLVHFPKNNGYYLDENSQEFSQQYSDLFYRISYLAKKRTKHYGEGGRCFGCSSR